MAEKKRYRIWIISTLAFTSIVFCLFAIITIYVDPLFHYHAPLDQFAYPINDERYQNDGIVRNFEYNSIIAGTSMTQNFMTSEANELFDSIFIKVPFSGAYYKEINDNLERAYGAGKNIKYVIRSLDYAYLTSEKDAHADMDYPTYLYNDNLFDDMNYLLNKSILLEKTDRVLEYTKEGNKTTDFDEYGNWSAGATFGREAVLNNYVLDEPAGGLRILTEEDKILLLENIRQNVTDLADKHPETTFYLFFTPYSICNWNLWFNRGQVNWFIDMEKIAIEEILRHPNIKLYSFNTNFELVCNLDNYKDPCHYGEWINSDILRWMHDGDYLLTWDNYQEYIAKIKEFYGSYDYDLLQK